MLNRRGIFKFLGIGAVTATAVTPAVLIQSVPKPLNLNRGKPGSVLASLESTIKNTD